jgi:hypothetical protein
MLPSSNADEDRDRNDDDPQQVDEDRFAKPTHA